jgi:hypothetical protein
MPMRRLAGACVAVLAFVACGDSAEDPDQQAIRTAVARFLDDDRPRRCDVQTPRFIINREGKSDPEAARQECLQNASDGRTDLRDGLLAIAPPRRRTVSEIEVSGNTARAAVRFEGGAFGGEVVDVTLAKRGDTWMIDGLDGLEMGARGRQAYDRQIANELKPALMSRGAPVEEVEAVVGCIVARVRRAIPNDSLAALEEGKLAPGELNQSFDEAASACLRG